MAIWGCGLPAHCCQPAVARGVIYADLWGELSIHLALQALFTQSSLVRELLLQAFPFPSTLREVTLHPLSQACVFVYSSHGKWCSPISCGVFLPLPLLLLLLDAGQLLPLLPSPAGLFIYSSMRDFPSHPLLCSGHPALLATCLFCCYWLLLSFSFFPWVGVGLSRGLCWSGPGLSVGLLRTVKLTLWSASSQAICAWRWSRSPPGFSV
jgi:hypothetical protein